MTEPMITKEGIQRIAILTGAVIVGFAIYYPFSPRAEQNALLRTADKHNAYLNEEFYNDPRFNQVTVYTWIADEDFPVLAGEVVLHIDGNVAARADLATLATFVSNSVPPVPVIWAVTSARTTIVEGVSVTGQWSDMEIKWHSAPTN